MIISKFDMNCLFWVIMFNMSNAIKDFHCAGFPDTYMFVKNIIIESRRL